MAVCLDCASAGTNPPPVSSDQQIRRTLLQDIFKLTAVVDEAYAQFAGAMRIIPNDLPHPDGAQRIKNISTKLSTVREELMKAHRRLENYSDHGIISDDLEQ